ncbi:MAG TPA: hypothetical protein VGG33_05395 [Polyangia bacterium]
MFRLLSFFVTILGFAAVVWFGVTVELGERTLFGHLRAIGGSNEAKQLWDGTRNKVTDLVGPAGKNAIEGAGILKDSLTKNEKSDPGSPKDKDKGPAVERAKAPTATPAKAARDAAPGKHLARAPGKPPAPRSDTAAK